MRQVLFDKGMKTPTRLKVVNYIFSSAMALRAISNILDMTSGMNRKALIDLPAWPLLLILFYVALEVVPIFTVLLGIRFRSHVEEQVNVSTIGSRLNTYSHNSGSQSDKSASGRSWEPVKLANY